MFGEVLPITLGLGRHFDRRDIRWFVTGVTAQGLRQHQRLFVLQTPLGLQCLVDSKFQRSLRLALQFGPFHHEA